jgi:hypothetical protein
MTWWGILKRGVSSAWPGYWGMDQEVKRLLDSTVFNESLPWNQIDQDLSRVRFGAPVLAKQLTDSMRLTLEYC